MVVMEAIADLLPNWDVNMDLNRVIGEAFFFG